MLARVTFGFSQKCYTCNVVLGVVLSNNNGQYQLILSHCESFLLLRLDHTGIGIAVDKLEEIQQFQIFQDSLVSHKNVTRAGFVSALHSLVEIILVGNVT